MTKWINNQHWSVVWRMAKHLYIFLFCLLLGDCVNNDRQLKFLDIFYSVYIFVAPEHAQIAAILSERLWLRSIQCFSQILFSLFTISSIHTYIFISVCHFQTRSSRFLSLFHTKYHGIAACSTPNWNRNHNREIVQCSLWLIYIILFWLLHFLYLL